jgi:hypothetical protein
MPKRVMYPIASVGVWMAVIARSETPADPARGCP